MRKSASWLLALLLLATIACTSRPQQNSREFVSFDSFVEALESAAGSGKRSQVNGFWNALVDNERVRLSWMIRWP
jgi:hypothetical protein